jgi:hypothetical protein
MEHLEEVKYSAHLYEESKEKNGHPATEILESDGFGSPDR